MEQENKKKLDNRAIAFLSLSLVMIWVGFYLSYPNIFEQQKGKQELALQKMAEQENIRQQKYFGSLDLEAQAFAVYDLEKGEFVAGKNENEILPLASITKVMTILVASENYGSQESVAINQPADGSDSGLRSGEKWRLSNLAALTLVSSSNAGATALAGADQENFVAQMNKKAKDLGLDDLHFSNPTGLDNGPEPGGRGSALSVAKLFAYAVHNKPELLTATRESSIQEKSDDGFNHLVLNTNEIVNEIPGLIASKTGFTARAGGNLGIVANLGLQKPVAIVVLGSSEKGRFSDVKKIISATLNYYSNLSFEETNSKS